MAAPAFPPLPEALSSLKDLALDLRWTWSHEADALWEQIQPELWEKSHNPWTMLQNSPSARLVQLANDPQFVLELKDLVDKRDSYRNRTTWFDKVHGPAALREVAYFSMEFGLGSALPLYAGGLGVLAGDFLKAASDLGVPIVGVGLLYQEGYFRQTLDNEGGQRETYPFNDPATMPIEPAMVEGQWLRVAVDLPGRLLHLRVWRAHVGRRMLCLLDSNDPLNSPSDRGVTGKLYGGDAEVRLIQELALGVGGWRALEALGHTVEVCHINEGHAAFALIERARSLAAQNGLTFSQALWATRAGNIFTTHTPVASGFDRFDPDLVRRHLSCMEGLSADAGSLTRDILRLGRAEPQDEAEPFNMAYLAMRGCAHCLGVSRLHEQLSRRIFQPLFPRWPEGEVPVGHVTNGVHTPTWDSAQADRVWTDACGKERWLAPAVELSDRITDAADQEIWAMRGQARQNLVHHVRSRLSSQLGARGLGVDALRTAQSVLDANVLTLGFARRFTDYKRPNLLLHDPDRLARMLLNEQRPAQIVIAGKAHPSDDLGKQMIRQWIKIADQPRFRRRIVFLEDYDLGVAQELVQGVDVWINTPRRPWEACGTSGMKVLVNGGLNCSVLDGWWAEAYQPELGWRIGCGENNEGGQRDAAEAEDTYELIEQHIAPEFYARDETGIPRAWLARIRRSMSTLTSRFSSARQLSEYVESAYLPSASALRRRLSAEHATAKTLADWSERMSRNWPSVHIGSPTVARGDSCWRFAVPVFLSEILPGEVCVQLYADPKAGDASIAIALDPIQAIAGAANGYVFAGDAPASRPASDFTVRVIPRPSDAAIPAEIALIAWQR